MYNIKQGHTLSERKKLHGTLHMHDLASCIIHKCTCGHSMAHRKEQERLTIGGEEGLDAGNRHELRKTVED